MEFSLRMRKKPRSCWWPYRMDLFMVEFLKVARLAFMLLVLFLISFNNNVIVTEFVCVSFEEIKIWNWCEGNKKQQCLELESFIILYILCCELHNKLHFKAFISTSLSLSLVSLFFYHTTFKDYGSKINKPSWVLN